MERRFGSDPISGCRGVARPTRWSTRSPAITEDGRDATALLVVGDQIRVRPPIPDPRQRALTTVTTAIPSHWRRGRVERADLPRFLFEADDVVVVVGQDGLVANVAKYLDGQPVIGVDPDPHRHPGVLVAHPADAAGALMQAAVDGHPDLESRTMVSAVTDDGKHLDSVNEIYVGHASHQTSRYRLTLPDGRTERQASSGLIVATGTGATGWCRTIWTQCHSELALPNPEDARLCRFVREAWPSHANGTTLTEGALAGSGLTVDVDSETVVAFGDGIEAGLLTSW